MPEARPPAPPPAAPAAPAAGPFPTPPLATRSAPVAARFAAFAILLDIASRAKATSGGRLGGGGKRAVLKGSGGGVRTFFQPRFFPFCDSKGFDTCFPKPKHRLKTRNRLEAAAAAAALGTMGSLGGDGGGAEDVSRATVFVRNLPYSATDQQLEDAFSEVGPVRSAFCVRQKGNSGVRGRGMGGGKP